VARHATTQTPRTKARPRKMRARNNRTIKILSFVIALFAVFIIGFLLRGNSSLLDSLGFSPSVTGITKEEAESGLSKDAYNSLSARISEVEDILATDSLDTYDLDTITGDVLTAFATSSGDPYVRYYSPARYQELLNTQNEGYAGIGVLFSEYDGAAYVVDVFEGSPAQLEGVQVGDFVVSVDGDRAQTWSRSEVASYLSQHEGQSVVITWRRPESLESGGGREFTTTLQCAEYSEPNVTTEYYEDDHVGYIRVKQFTQNSASMVEKAISELEARGAESLVLDLRDNPGGYLSQAVDIASLFLNSGTVVEIRTIDGQSAKAATGKTATDMPLVVIDNKNTAAAAEVVAAALKENQRATIVGVTTLGKGSVQVLHELSFGGAIRYTAAYYLTPEGHAIDQVGVTPTVMVDTGRDDDAQKQYALEVARSYVGA